VKKVKPQTPKAVLKASEIESSELETLETDLTELEGDEEKFHVLLEKNRVEFEKANSDSSAAIRAGSIMASLEHSDLAAKLEGQGRAIRSMLEQHQAQIATVKQKIETFKQQDEAAVLWQKVSGVVGQLEQVQHDHDEVVLELRETIGAAVKELGGHRTQWVALRREWLALVRDLNLNLNDRVAVQNALRGRGLNAQAVLVKPWGLQGEDDVSAPRVDRVLRGSTRLDLLTRVVAREAVRQYRTAQGYSNPDHFSDLKVDYP
jgi:hypothetical protein